jgi:hypothetical protein
MKRLLLGFLLVIASGVIVAEAQVAACDASGKQIVARRWDVVLGHEWEMVRDCRHPEWPARARSVKSLIERPANPVANPPASPTAIFVEPLLIRAGEPVKLWQQAAYVRMEMNGVAEQAARRGEHIDVLVTRHNDDGSITSTHLSGTVRAAGDVEMDR